MALTPSAMLALGTPAPEFLLPDILTGRSISLASYAQRKALLIMFICGHCPYVKHIQPELSRLENDYAARDIGMVAISANDPGQHPDDSPKNLRHAAKSWCFVFPFCYDESQETAKAYKAACTPDFFLFNAERRLVYRGQFDDSRPGNAIPVTGNDLRAAIEAALHDRPVNPRQKPSLGCNIKWKQGKEPAYAQSS